MATLAHIFQLVANAAFYVSLAGALLSVLLLVYERGDGGQERTTQMLWALGACIIMGVASWLVGVMVKW